VSRVPRPFCPIIGGPNHLYPTFAVAAAAWSCQPHHRGWPSLTSRSSLWLSVSSLHGGTKAAFNLFARVVVCTPQRRYGAWLSCFLILHLHGGCKAVLIHAVANALCPIKPRHEGWRRDFPITAGRQDLAGWRAPRDGLYDPDTPT